MPTVWKNKATGLWLIETTRPTHTGEHKEFSETDDLQQASVLRAPDYSLRRRAKYEPVLVNVVRTLTIKEV